VAVPLWVWSAFVGFVLVVLALDLGVWHRRAHVIGAREAAKWTAIWFALAILFAALVAWRAGGSAALTFLTGYAIEQSLSIDNVFVIAVILAQFQIPPAYQHRVLFWGVLGAVLMRGVFIASGSFLLGRFEWVQYIFGAFLLVAAVRIRKHRDARLEVGQNAVLRVLQRVLPIRSTLAGQRLVARDPERGNRWSATPLLVALVFIELSDIALATDSIPAIFAVTRNPFLIFTSNVFAVLGLRSLYFVLAEAIRRFRNLPTALAIILGFVGLKMLLASVVTVPTGVVLGVIVAVLAVALRTGTGDQGPAIGKKS
jgi:tellurite resistance protein TerC